MSDPDPRGRYDEKKTNGVDNEHDHDHDDENGEKRRR